MVVVSYFMGLSVVFHRDHFIHSFSSFHVSVLNLSVTSMHDFACSNLLEFI